MSTETIILLLYAVPPVLVSVFGLGMLRDADARLREAKRRFCEKLEDGR